MPGQRARRRYREYRLTGGDRRQPRAPQYAAAKYAVIGLTKSYARALAPKVRVNTLGAAFMETEALREPPRLEDWPAGGGPASRPARLHRNA